VEYRGPGWIDPNPLSLWKGPRSFSKIRGITINYPYLYACDIEHNSVIQFALSDGTITDTWKPFVQDSNIVYLPPLTSSSRPSHSTIRPHCIEFFNNHLYICNNQGIQIMSNTNQYISSFPFISKVGSWMPFAMKIDVTENKIFIYIQFVSELQIYKYSETGELIEIMDSYTTRKKDKISYALGPFSFDQKFMYKLETMLHKGIIINGKTNELEMEIGTHGSSVGGFIHPSAIYLSNEEKVLYIGDIFSVQIFTLRGQCLQRIGRTLNQMAMGGLFATIYSIAEYGDHLYVTDSDGIQSFRTCA